MQKLGLLLTGSIASLMMGCTTLGNLATPAASPFVQIAVDVGVATAVGVGPAAHAKAVGISAAAQAALAVDQGNAVTLTVIEAAINAQIAKLNLPPADKLAFGVLTQTLGAIVTQSLSGGAVMTPAGTVTSKAQVAIALVLQDVIAACAVY